MVLNAWDTFTYLVLNVLMFMCACVCTGLGGRVVYSLLDSSGVFSLDAESGVLSLERNLDREQRSSWRLLVCARDRGEPALSSLANVTVTVLDVNDNPPVFARRDYLTTLREDVTVGTEVRLCVCICV